MERRFPYLEDDRLAMLSSGMIHSNSLSHGDAAAVKGLLYAALSAVTDTALRQAIQRTLGLR